MRIRILVAFAFAFALVACSEDEDGLDGGRKDAAPYDGGFAADAEPMDGTTPTDAGLVDAGVPDGGSPDGGAPLDSGCVLTSGAGQARFEAVAGAQRARTTHTAQRLRDGRVLLAGGFAEGGSFDPDVEIFDPTDDSVAVGMPRPETGAVARGVALSDGRVLVMNGIGGPTFLFDANTGWTRTATAPAVLPSATVVIPDGRVLLVAGTRSGQPIRDVHAFDPVDESWSLLVTLEATNGGVGAAVLGDGRVFVVGGGMRMPTIAATEFIDVQTATVTAGPPLTTPRLGTNVVPLLDRRVLVFGGQAIGERHTEIYDPATDAFESILSAPGAAVAPAIVRLCDGRVAQLAGRSAQNPVADTNAWLFDPASDRWTRTSATMPSRQGAEATLLEDGRVLVSGGGLLGGSAPPSLYLFVPDAP